MPTNHETFRNTINIETFQNPDLHIVDIETSCEKCDIKYATRMTWLDADPDHMHVVQELRDLVKELIRQLVLGKKKIVINRPRGL